MANLFLPLKRKTLSQWLLWQEVLHRKPIELGLERVSEVAERLGLNEPSHPVITVAGTNGKGSCVAFLESIYTQAGYRVGSYSSPHIQRYNERVRIEGQEVSDEALCNAFASVEQARGTVSLSYFEFGTLAAMSIFARTPLDIAILEVGLGGRLDAVNLQDADLAVITSIGIDHTEWLGEDREAIGFEKAGILREKIPAVCGDSDPPASIRDRAHVLRAPLYVLGTDFSYETSEDGWEWRGPSESWTHLPQPRLLGDVQLNNAATALMVVNLFEHRLAVDQTAVKAGLRKATLPGRFQRLKTSTETVVDLAHNPDAARALADTLRGQPTRGRTHAVFAVLSDKDAGGMVDALSEITDYWYVAELKSPRARPVQELVATVRKTLPRAKLSHFDSVTEAYTAACSRANSCDRIVVFGSALCVSEVLSAVNR